MEGLTELSGQLNQGSVPRLLQMLASLQVSGELVLTSDPAIAQNQQTLVRFMAGRPTHARSGNLVGREALIEVLDYHRGELRFVASSGFDTEVISIEDSLENILMAALMQQKKGPPALDGLTLQDIPVVRQNDDLNSSIILEQLHIQVATIADGRKNILQLAQELQLDPKSVLQAVFDLKRAGLLGLSSLTTADVNPNARYSLRLRERLKGKARERAAERLAPMLKLSNEKTEELLERKGKLFQPGALANMQRVAEAFGQAGVEVELVLVDS
jgi:Domain of unknown function (DUF4388)